MVELAARRGELPETYAAFAAGELAVDQVAVVAKYVPDHCDPQRPNVQDRCDFHFGDDSRFSVQVDADADAGAVIEKALREARDALFRAGDRDVSWLDALVEVCHGR